MPTLSLLSSPSFLPPSLPVFTGPDGYLRFVVVPAAAALPPGISGEAAVRVLRFTGAPSTTWLVHGGHRSARVPLVFGPAARLSKRSARASSGKGRAAREAARRRDEILARYCGPAMIFAEDVFRHRLVLPLVAGGFIANLPSGGSRYMPAVAVEVCIEPDGGLDWRLRYYEAAARAARKVTTRSQKRR